MLFGDEDLEAGKTDLKPENSHNVNLNLGYSRHFGEHYVNAEGTLIFRDTKDYIQRGLSTVSGMSYGFYENYGRVRTQGYNWLSIGGTFSNINVRDHERYVAGNTLQESETYGQRMPNQPYMFASFDAIFTWHNLLADGNTLTLAYDGYYQHAFPLYWEHFGDPASKSVVRARPALTQPEHQLLPPERKIQHIPGMPQLHKRKAVRQFQPPEGRTRLLRQGTRIFRKQTLILI